MQLSESDIWLIGASEGIGRELALQLALRGARLHVSARSQQRLDALVSEMKGTGHSVCRLDVTEPQAVKDCYHSITQAHPKCTSVIYNAGTYTPMPIDAWNLQTCKQTMDVNFTGFLHVLDAVLPTLKAKRNGHLLVVSSVAAYRGLPKSMCYGASKAALTNLVECLRLELAPYNITVQLVSPGFVKTRLTEQNDFPMPFAIGAEQAAIEIANGMQRGIYDIHFPKAFTWFMKLMRILPTPIYHFIARKL